MPAYVALLRGINVGKAKRIPMAELRSVLQGLGYNRVATLLNSGNAVFLARTGSPEAHAKAITNELRRQFHFEVPVVVKSASELDRITQENVLAASVQNPSRLLVAFAQDHTALAGLSHLGALVVPPEEFVLGKHAAFLDCPAGFLQSRAATAILGTFGKTVTTRNWATVLKLHALAAKCDA
jgi:uncharacterized protein (DUF1697 family)